MPFEVQHQVDLPTGAFLRAQLKELEFKKIPYTDKKTGEAKTFEKLEWLFEVTEQGEYNGKTVKAESNTFLSDSPYNQFRNWSEALLQRPLGVGQIVNESDLVGLSALITVKREPDSRDSSKSWPRVDEVIPLDPAAGDQPPF